MLLYECIVQPVSVYSAFIVFLQKGQSKRKGVNASFSMRTELTEQDFQLEKRQAGYETVFRLIGMILRCFS